MAKLTLIPIQTDVILKRRTVRNYELKDLSLDDKHKLDEIVQNAELMKGPFGHSFKFFILALKDGEPDVARPIGTYGTIKNAPYFIGGSSPKDHHAIVDYGFIFEHMVLSLTAQGLGTAWLGALFQREKLRDYCQVDETIPAIATLGYSAEHMHLRERFTRFGIGSDHRKEFGTLFFNASFETPLSQDHPYAELLRLVQVAPSGTNQQPWRIRVDDQHLHLYMCPTPNYSKKLDFESQYLDMGIALAHLSLGLTERAIPFDYVNLDYPSTNSLIYVVSLRLNP